MRQHPNKTSKNSQFALVNGHSRPAFRADFVTTKICLQVLADWVKGRRKQNISKICQTASAFGQTRTKMSRDFHLNHIAKFSCFCFLLGEGGLGESSPGLRLGVTERSQVDVKFVSIHVAAGLSAVADFGCFKKLFEKLEKCVGFRFGMNKKVLCCETFSETRDFVLGMTTTLPNALWQK